MKIVTIQVDFD